MERGEEMRAARGRGFCSDNVSARTDDHTLAESEGVDVHPESSLQLHPRSISNALIAPLPQMMLIISLQNEPSPESRGLEKWGLARGRGRGNHSHDNFVYVTSRRG